MSLTIKHNGLQYNVATIEDLPTTDLEENQVVVVADEARGGTFIYRNAESSVNNGGTIFNGWTRQYDGAVNVKWFGTVDSTSLKNSLAMGDTFIDEVSPVTLNTLDVEPILANISNLIIGVNVLTIELPKGIYNFSESIRIINNNLGNLKILGVEPEQVSISEQKSISGSSGAFEVVLSVDNSTAEIGDFLHTIDVIGTGSVEIHRGIWEIIAASSTEITVKNTCWTDSFPSNTITSSNSYIIKSILKFANSDGITLYDSALGLIDNIAVVGNSDDYWSESDVTGTELGTHGILVGAPSVSVNGKIENSNMNGISNASISFGSRFGVNGFDQQGIVTENNGSAMGDFVTSCNNKRRGFYASTGSGIRAKHISANGNFINGCIADIGGALYSSSNSCACGNGSDGIVSFHNGALIFDTGIVKSNGASGVVAKYGGFAQATGSYISNNNVYGVESTVGGVAYVSSSEILNNPSKGLVAQINGLIRADNSTIGGSSRAIEASSNSTIYASDTNILDGSTMNNDSFIYLNSAVYTPSSNVYKQRFIDNNTNKGFELVTLSGGDATLRFDNGGAGTFTDTLIFRSGGDKFYAHSDNSMDIGRPTNRFKTLYTGAINASNLPTTDPTVTGEVWNDNGTLKVSAG